MEHWPIYIYKSANPKSQIPNKTKNFKTKILNDLKKEFRDEKKKYFKYMDSYKFSMAFETLYQFIWHRYADYYIEELKEPLRNGNIKVLDALKEVYFGNLIMLHPFMPFVTEAVWKIFNTNSILDSKLWNEHGSRKRQKEIKNTAFWWEWKQKAEETFWKGDDKKEEKN